MNLEASKLLMENEFYPTVCHSAYYSCFQFAKYNLIKDLNCSDLEYFESQLRKKGSHKFVIDKTKEFIKLKEGKKVAQIFYNKIKTLKAYRIEADYYNKSFKENEAVISMDLASEILDIIKGA